MTREASRLNPGRSALLLGERTAQNRGVLRAWVKAHRAGPERSPREAGRCPSLDTEASAQDGHGWR